MKEIRVVLENGHVKYVLVGTKISDNKIDEYLSHLFGLTKWHTWEEE